MKYISKYSFRNKRSDKLVGTKMVADYNRQPVEIDANAFAVLTMNYYFGIMPLFQNLDDDLRTEIYNKASRLASEYLKNHLTK